MAGAGFVMRHPRLYAAALRLVRLGRLLPRHRRLPGPGLSAWTAARDLPELPKQTFRDWHAEERRR